MTGAEQDTKRLSASYDRVSHAQFGLGLELARLMGIAEGESAVDVGCGTGRLTFEVGKIVGPSGTVRGLDPSPHRIELARTKMQECQCRSELWVGEAGDLRRIPDASVDHVYYASVFHWIDNKADALTEAYRVLRPGGKIGIVTIALDAPFTFTDVLLAVLLRPKYRSLARHGGTKKVSRPVMRDLLQLAGFTDLQIDVRIRMNYSTSGRDVIKFFEASSFGNFLSDVPAEMMDEVLADLEAELESRRQPEGIEMSSNSMFAIGRKPL